MKRILSCIFILSIFSLISACNQGESQPPETQPAPKQVQVSWSTSAESIVPGETFHLLWTFEMAEGWHLYWMGRNDSGYPPSVKLDLPAGWKAGPLLWPSPERYESAGDILDHVYHEKLQLVQEVTVGQVVPQDLPLQFSARVDWLACKNECVPGHEVVALVFSDGNEAEATQVDAVLERLPQAAPAGGVSVLWDATSVTLSVPEATKLEFYPSDDCLKLRDLLEDGSVQGNKIRLGLRPEDDNDGPLNGILHQILLDGSTRNWIIDVKPGGE